jgi:hypothetical protein
MAIIFGFPLVGTAIGLLLPPLARWLLTLPIPLMRIVFVGLAKIDQPWEIAGWLLGGFVLGAATAWVTLTESVTVTVGEDELQLANDDRRNRVRKADLAAIFLDGTRLVALDHDSRQLAGETMSVSRNRLERAFRDRGYPWCDADPYADLYQRWVRDAPDLPAEVHAVLTARAEAIRKKSDRDIRELRAVVERLGFSVRDEDGHQYWRPLVRS